MFKPSGTDKVGRKRARAEQAGRVVEPIHVEPMHIQTACIRRRGRGGDVWFGAFHPPNISSPLQGPVRTNNRAELTARLEALRAVRLS